MTNNINTKKKRTYIKPEVEKIQMDNEIYMVMMSAPPGDPEVSVKKVVKQMLGLA